MNTTSSDLTEFHLFVGERIENGGSDLSPEACLELWRAEQPRSDELRESVATVKKALSDMESGDTGLPAREILGQFREKLDRARGA